MCPRRGRCSGGRQADPAEAGIKPQSQLVIFTTDHRGRKFVWSLSEGGSDASEFDVKRKAIMTKLVMVHRELDDLEAGA